MMLINTALPSVAPAGSDGAAITAGRFWPEIDPVAARAALRLDGTVTPIRLRHALVEAIASVNAELADWRTAKQAAGFAALADLPADSIDGQSVLVLRWVRAVYASAGADLAERYRSFDTTGQATHRADDWDSTADDLRRDARSAVRALLGVSHYTVELI